MATTVGNNTLEKVLESIAARLRRLETPKYVSLGGWRITENLSGELVAEHPASGQVIVLAAIEPS